MTELIGIRKGMESAPDLVLSRPYIHLPDPFPQQSLKIIRLVRRFLLRRRNLSSSSKIRCCYIIISTELKGIHTLEQNELFCCVSIQFSSVAVVSDSLRPHESQHARPPCPSPSPGVLSDSRPSSQ